MADKNSDPHKMRPEDVKKYGVEGSKRPPGHNPGEVLHQRRNLPFSRTQMAIAGFVIVSAIGYLTLYSLKKPGTTHGDLVKATTGFPDEGPSPAVTRNRSE